MDEDFKIEPVNMMQSMHIASIMVHGLIVQFIKEEDSEENKITATYICLAVFFHAICQQAKYKDKMIGVLECIIADLKDKA